MENIAETKCISLKIKSRPENVLLVRLAVKSIVSHVIQDEMEAYQIVLGLVEAVNNIIIHAYQYQQDQDIRISVSLGHGHIRFTLTDNGLPAQNLAKNESHFDSGDLKTLPEGGMGLYLIHSIMDEVAYEPGNTQNTLTLVKYYGK